MSAVEDTVGWCLRQALLHARLAEHSSQRARAVYRDVVREGRVGAAAAKEARRHEFSECDHAGAAAGYAFRAAELAQEVR